MRSHKHLPPFIIHAVSCGKPGLFVVRKPEPAIVSWAIHCGSGLAPALDYYLDFHQVMRPYLPELFVARFEVITGNFPEVMDAFNFRFGTNYRSEPADEETRARCFARIEELWREPNGKLDEMRVARPSAARAEMAAGLLGRLRQEQSFQRKLREAGKFYEEFAGAAEREFSQPRVIRFDPKRLLGSGRPLLQPAGGMSERRGSLMAEAMTPRKPGFAALVPASWGNTYRNAKAWFMAGEARSAERKVSAREVFRTHWVTIAASLAMLLGVAWLDFLTGPEVALGPFYLVPCAILALVVGGRSGSIAAFASAFSTTLFRAPPGVPGRIAIWNFAMRLIFFELVVLLLARVRYELERQGENSGATEGTQAGGSLRAGRA
jgi:hypothetical protein